MIQIILDLKMIQASAKHISESTSQESLEDKAVRIISWTRRHGKSFSKTPIVDFVEGRFVVVNKRHYQPLIDKVVSLLKTEYTKLSAT